MLLYDVGYELNTDPATGVVGNRDENFIDVHVSNMTTCLKYVRGQAMFI